MPQTFFHKLHLPVGAAQNRDVRKRAHDASLFGPMRLQHAKSAGHRGNLAGNGNALGKFVCRLDQAHRLTAGPIGQKHAFRAWIGRDGGQRR